jgi:hypothetical protein
LRQFGFLERERRWLQSGRKRSLLRRPKSARLPPLLIVFGLVGLVLVIACVTVATLFEARRGLHQREMAVRLSLGASR